MLKILLLFIGSIFVLYAQADQQSILNSEEAQKTVEFLETQNEMIIYCGCCSHIPHVKITISEVTYECEASNWCKVRVKGVDVITKEEVDHRLDLAYAWINVDGMAYNLAWQMELTASPCVPSFNWDTFEPVPAGKMVFSKEEVKTVNDNFETIRSILELDTGFTLETYQSNKEFDVDSVRVKLMGLGHSIIISQFGANIEHRFTIPMGKLKDLYIDHQGIHFKTMEDGVVLLEEFEGSMLIVRTGYLKWLIPLNTENQELKDSFNAIWKIHSMKNE